jgi:hypothetical protein
VQDWKYKNAPRKIINELQPLLKAAYPGLAPTYTNSAELSLHWAGKIEVTQWMIAFANELGLVHFGRFKKEDPGDVFRLEFSDPQKRNNHLIKLGWELSTYTDTSNPRLDVFIKVSSVNYFIDQFWSNEIDQKLKTRARKAGLTLRGMQRHLHQQETQLKLILGDERATFDLLVDSIINNHA